MSAAAAGRFAGAPGTLAAASGTCAGDCGTHAAGRTLLAAERIKNDPDTANVPERADNMPGRIAN